MPATQTGKARRERRDRAGASVAGPSGRPGGLHTSLFLLSLLLTPLLVAAPDLDAQASAARGDGVDDGPRIGLVLSGGSAKGLAHVGVLGVLEREGLDVDVVTGTSMGAVVGGLYAAGLSPDSLASLVTGLDWDAVLGDRVPRDRLALDRRQQDDRTLISVPFAEERIRLPSGVVEGAGVLRLLEELTWPWAGVRDFRRLPRAFASVATDLETGEAVRLDHGVLPHALRASMSIPGAIRPFRWDDRVLIDGALSRNLPAVDAIALGATHLICVDVSSSLDPAEEIESFVHVLQQAVQFRVNASTSAQRQLCDVLIRPETEGLSQMAFAEADAWLGRGERAAGEAIPRLRRLRDAVTDGWSDDARTAAPAQPLPDSVRVSDVRIDGVEAPEAVKIVRRALPLTASGYVSPGALRRAFEELTAVGLFSDLRYRLDVSPSDTTLTIGLQDESRDRLGLGLRYDDEHGASLLFTAMVTDWLHYGSLATLDVRLGEEVQIEGRYLRGRGVTSAFSLGGSLGWSRAPFDIRDGGGPVARVETDVVSSELLAGVAVDRGTLLSLAARGEWVHGGTLVAPTDTAEQQVMGSLAAVLRRESADRVAFPTRGTRFLARAEAGLGTLRRGGGFHQALAQSTSWVPLHPRVTGVVRLFVGDAGGADLPLHRHFFLGGVNPSSVYAASQPAFYGMEPQERRGTAAQLLGLRLRVEVSDGRFVSLGVDVGDAFPAWRLAPSEYALGWGAEVGTESVVGPVRVTVHGRELAGWPSFAVSVGRWF